MQSLARHPSDLQFLAVTCCSRLSWLLHNKFLSYVRFHDVSLRPFQPAWNQKLGLNQYIHPFDQNSFLLSLSWCVHMDCLLHVFSHFQTVCTYHIKCRPLDFTKATQHQLIPFVFLFHVTQEIIATCLTLVAKQKLTLMLRSNVTTESMTCPGPLAYPYIKMWQKEARKAVSTLCLTINWSVGWAHHNPWTCWSAHRQCYYGYTFFLNQWWPGRASIPI